MYVLIPGFGGSNFADTTGAVTWYSTPQIVTGVFERLKLDPETGTLPAPGIGTVQTPTSILGIYSDLLNRLNKGNNGWPITSIGYGVYPWDWRMDLETQGELLAAQLSRAWGARAPHRIVAHSAGGLLARAAWRALKKQGKSNVIARIVTLGTPHQGAVSTVEALAGFTPEMLDLARWTKLGPGTEKLRWAGIDWYVNRSAIEVVATWPSLYQLLPYPDPNQYLGESVYVRSNWPTWWPVQSNWLDRGKAWWKDVMNDPDSVPPYSVMTTVGGTGNETPIALNNFPFHTRERWWKSDFLGDGTVSLSSGRLDGGKRYNLACSHLGLLSHPYVLDNIVKWLDETNVGPPAPPIEIPSPQGKPVPNNNVFALPVEKPAEVPPSRDVAHFLPQIDKAPVTPAPTPAQTSRPGFNDIPDPPFRRRAKR